MMSSVITLARSRKVCIDWIGLLDETSFEFIFYSSFPGVGLLSMFNSVKDSLAPGKNHSY